MATAKTGFCRSNFLVGVFNQGTNPFIYCCVSMGTTLNPWLPVFHGLKESTIVLASYKVCVFGSSLNLLYKPGFWFSPWFYS